MEVSYRVQPVGTVRREGDGARLEIAPRFREALDGLDGFSHVTVLYWFHENDDPGSRGMLKVHPRGDRNNPLTGVFATHAPVRPNLIAATLCRIVAVVADGLRVAAIDARDGSPILDLKPYIPPDPPPDGVRLPQWVRGAAGSQSGNSPLDNGS